MNDLLAFLNETRANICKLVKTTSDELDSAKIKIHSQNFPYKRTQKLLTIYYNNYRQDKLYIKDTYYKYINILITAIRNYQKYNLTKNLEKIYIYSLNLIGFHESTITINEFNESNGNQYLSNAGYLLVSSFDFSKLYEIVEIIKKEV